MAERADDLVERLLSGPVDDGPRHAFHRSLDGIDDVFTAAATSVGEAMPRFHRAYLAGDEHILPEVRTLARRVAADMADVEHGAFVLLARESPVGRDLRRIVAILRLVHDVDRCAALLRHVCETMRRLDPRSLPPGLYAAVDELGRRATDVYVRGVDAWRRRDALAVAEVDQLDELVDRLQLQLYADLAAKDGLGDAPLVVGLVTRYYERLADHAVTIARDTSFVATGERVGARP